MSETISFFCRPGRSRTGTAKGALLMGLSLTACLATPLMAQSQLPARTAAILQDGLIVTADAFILPSYERWAEATDGLALSLERYCEGNDGIGAAETAFRESFLAWQQASLIQTGPAMDLEAPLRVQLWPDAKGFSRRAVRAALASEDPALLTTAGLDAQSIALPNLTALEVLIFDDLAPGSFACDLATSIGRYQSGLAGSIAADWAEGSAFRAEFDTAMTGNTRYRAVDDLARELLSGMVVHTDRLQRFKIRRGLGAEPGDARSERTEAMRSGLGLASIEAGFRALAAIYEVPCGFFDVTPEIGGPVDYRVLARTADNVANSISAETSSLTEIAQEDGAAAVELRGYGDLISYQQDYLKIGLPQSIGFTSGFTSADGD
ncbi:imelysin family protein [Tropicimonas sp. TH_r6]|uniref:imelysin family protein n=1 Tax=Tropicimonas sp. TH_r6 TaxID=3082085 RepID=UPI002952B28E|nr:imelysin family protein [Tropicimonas sp. TH_r6]MDV7141469.1 imelysin family protein [Tropicimonas sp. TH_r6]